MNIRLAKIDPFAAMLMTLDRIGPATLDVIAFESDFDFASVLDAMHGLRESGEVVGHGTPPFFRPTGSIAPSTQLEIVMAEAREALWRPLPRNELLRWLGSHGHVLAQAAVRALELSGEIEQQDGLLTLLPVSPPASDSVESAANDPRDQRLDHPDELPPSSLKPQPVIDRVLLLMSDGVGRRKIDVSKELSINRGVTCRAMQQLVGWGKLITLADGFFAITPTRGSSPPKPLRRRRLHQMTVAERIMMLASDGKSRLKVEIASALETHRGVVNRVVDQLCVNGELLAKANNYYVRANPEADNLPCV